MSGSRCRTDSCPTGSDPSSRTPSRCRRIWSTCLIVCPRSRNRTVTATTVSAAGSWGRCLTAARAPRASRSSSANGTSTSTSTYPRRCRTDCSGHESRHVHLGDHPGSLRVSEGRPAGRLTLRHRAGRVPRSSDHRHPHREAGALHGAQARPSPDDHSLRRRGTRLQGLRVKRDERVGLRVVRAVQPLGVLYSTTRKFRAHRSAPSPSDARSTRSPSAKPRSARLTNTTRRPDQISR